MARVLVVDDEESIRILLKKLLGLHGHAVDTADDGAMAIDQLQKKRYDLMIIDHVMPKMSGVKAVSVIRSSPKYKDLKILMVTFSSLTKDVDAAFESGIDGYVVKPFNMDVILGKVESTLSKARPS